MMHSFISIVYFVFLVHVSYGWFTVTQPGQNGTDTPGGISTDSNGTLYISAYTDQSLFSTNAGGYDLYIAKYDKNGTFIQGAQYGASSNQVPNDHVMTPNETTLYAVGYTQGAWFGNFTGKACGFLVSIDTASLGLNWGAQLCGSINWTEFINVALPPGAGVIYVCGRTQGNVAGQINSGGLNDGLLARYNRSGSLNYVRLLGSPYANDDAIYDIKVDSSGNIWGTGWTAHTNYDCFVAKWNASGYLLQQKIFNNTAYHDSCYGIDLDGSGGVYLTGASLGVWNSAGVVTGYGNGYYQPFAMRLAADYSVTWVTQLSTVGGDAFMMTATKGSDNILYATGWATAVTFAGATSFGQYDVVFAAFSPTGQSLSPVLLGTSGSEYGVDIFVDNDLNIFITGMTNSAWASAYLPVNDVFWIKGTNILPASPSPSPSKSPFSSANPTPSGIGPLPSISPSSESSPSTSEAKKGGNIGLIAGIAAVGGLLLLGCVVGIAFFLVRRRKSQSPPKEDPRYVGYMESTSSMQMNEKTRSVRDTAWEIEYTKLERGRELGRGAFGVVYLAKWRNSDVAVKQLDTDNNNAQSTAVFLKEAQNVRNLRPHPNICTILGVCTDPQYPICIVMEYIPFGSLSDMLIEKKIVLDPQMIIQFAKDISSGMGHLHAESILHCDLACRNLLVSARGSDFQIKISDFGLSRMVESLEYEVSSNRKSLPVRWCAPETLKMGKLSRATDVWSFGITMWEMIEERQPYPNMSNTQVVEALERGFRLPQPTKQNLPKTFYELLLACWADRPSERPSFEDISKRLDDLDNQSTTSGSSTQQAKPNLGNQDNPTYTSFKPSDNSSNTIDNYNNIALVVSNNKN